MEMRVNLPDVQARKDSRGIILKAGVSKMELPVKIDDPLTPESVLGSFNIFVELPADQKGVNMSRFAQVLEEFTRKHVFNRESMIDLASRLKARHGDSQFATVKLKFRCVERHPSPTTDNGGPIPLEVVLEAESLRKRVAFYESLVVKSVTVCPCSLELSGGKSAHNQRADIEVRCKVKEFIPIGELSSMARQGSGDPCFVLKRQDEKDVVEKAFKNAKFSEDVARDVSLALDEDDRIEHYSVVVTCYESFHPYNVCAIVDSWS